ncbi:MAG: arginine--tRNA ligase, partial [Pseudomonadota bacterium]
MADLISVLTSACEEAFEQLGLERKWGAVRRSDRPELADFQCNGAMGAAKSAKRNPREIAEEIAAIVAGHDGVESCEVAGPGFLNIRVTTGILAERAEDVRISSQAGAEPAPDPERVLLDFGGPNVAKPMHVGHLRSAVIGDTLQRVLRFLGDDTVSDTHLGDWGLQMGHLVTELRDEQPDLIYFDADYTGPYPDDAPVTIDDLARLYPQASAKAKADEARNLRSQEAVAELQAGRPGYRALLRHFIDVSVAALKQDYAFLNVSFDLWKGESDVDHLIPEIVDLFKDKDLAREDDGAVIVDVAREGENVPVEGKDGSTKLKNAMPPIMLVNSRGGTGYHTTDLATILDRARMDAPPERMLYVVDQRQALHFEQVFRAADKAGLFPDDRMEHIGFGTVNGTDGKPFKTREGGVLRLADLNAMALEEAERKIVEADKLPARSSSPISAGSLSASTILR